MESKPLAVFDLDYTLLNGDSESMWNRFLFEQKVVDRVFLQRSTDYYHAYDQGWLDIHEYEAFFLRPITEQPLPRLYSLRNVYLKLIHRVVRIQIMQRVTRFRSLGFTLLLITASNSFIAEPIAQLLRIPNLICTNIKRDGEQYTTEIDGVPAFREGKVQRLELWLAETGLTLNGSWGYSDSHNDLPFLSRVEHPVAVMPDYELRKHAQKQGWKIIGV